MPSPRHLRRPSPPPRHHGPPRGNWGMPIAPPILGFRLPSDVALLLSGVGILGIGILFCFIFWPIGLASLALGGALIVGGAVMLRKRTRPQPAPPPPVTNVNVEVKTIPQTAPEHLKLKSSKKLRNFKTSKIKEKSGNKKPKTTS